MDHDLDQIDHFLQHLSLGDPGDDLAEQSHSLIEALGLQEGLSVQVHYRVEQGGELSHDIDIHSVFKRVFLSRLKIGFHGLCKDHGAQSID